MDIQCRDCGVLFEFSDGEAKFYQERNYSVPVRCKPCRELQKARRQGSSTGPNVSAPAPAVVAPSPSPSPRKRVIVMEEERKPPRKERTRRDTRIQPEYDED